MNERIAAWLRCTTVLALLLVSSAVAPAECRIAMQANTNVSPDPWPIEPFTLVDQHGQTFTEQRLQGRWTFVVFGDTHCTDTCASALSTLALMAKTLAPSRLGHDTQVLFISVDPERDTKERLRDYVVRFNAAFIGASGSRATLKQLAGEMSVSYRLPRHSSASTQVEHEAAIQLIGPENLLRAEFFPPHDAAALTATYVRMRFCRA